MGLAPAAMPEAAPTCALGQPVAWPVGLPLPSPHPASAGRSQHEEARKTGHASRQPEFAWWCGGQKKEPRSREKQPAASRRMQDARTHTHTPDPAPIGGRLWRLTDGHALLMVGDERVWCPHRATPWVDFAGHRVCLGRKKRSDLDDALMRARRQTAHRDALTWMEPRYTPTRRQSPPAPCESRETSDR